MSLIFDSNRTEIGLALAVAKTSLIPKASWIDDYGRYSVFSTILLGDPQMRVWTRSPNHLGVSCPQSLEIGSHDIEVLVSSGSATAGGALVTLSMDSTVYSLKLSSVDGIAKFDRVQLMHMGVLNVSVVLQDAFPQLEQISVVNNCCLALTGNVDADMADQCDISDYTTLIDYLFITGEPIQCPSEANMDGSADGVVDISDLSVLTDHLFISQLPNALCQ